MLTSPTRILFPKTGHTKEQIAAYYKYVAPAMLPFLKNFPVSLVRAPEGVASPKFYQRHPQEYFPAYIERVRVAEKEGSGVYILLDSYEDIEYLVNIGTIEFHQWHAKPESPNMANAMIFDLDPGPEVTIERLQEATWLLHERLTWEGFPNFVKTSGIKGYHIKVPRNGRAGWDEVRSDAKDIALSLSTKYPRLFTVEIKKEERKEKIFIDYLRNSRGATNVAPFSLRAYTKPTISVPFEWQELDEITPQKWQLGNIHEQEFLARARFWV